MSCGRRGGVRGNAALRTAVRRRDHHQSGDLLHDPSAALTARARGGTLLRLLGRLRPIALPASAASVATIAASAAALGIPLVLAALIDAAVSGDSTALDWLPGSGDRDRLIAGAVLLVVIGIARATLGAVQRYGTAWVGRTVATDFRRDVFRKLLGMEVGFHDRSSVGQLMTRVTDDTEQVRQFAATAVPEVVNIAVLLVGAAVVLLRTDLLLGAIALVCVPILGVLAVGAARQLLPRFLAVQQASGGLTARLQESLAQVRVVQAFLAQDRTGAAYERDNEVLYGRRLSIARVFISIFPVMSGVLALTTAVVLLLGGQRVIDGELSIGTLVLFDSYIILLGAPVRRLGFLLNLAARASASASRVYELLDREPAMVDAVDAAGPAPAEGAVAFTGVDFTYPRTTAPTLVDVDLRVAPGEHVAIVGRSGAGKSTLVELLPRLYDPDRGTVRIDDADLRDLTRSAITAAVGFVEQEAFLFSASVHDNIAFARPEASRDEVVAAARIAGADDFVSALADGYETVVGERGVTLSGGQRQRIALARALVARPPVLVLDDAVSAVDATTEARIRAALRDAGGTQTLIAVAQRLSTILAADRIVMLEAGRVVEQGTHAELLAADGAYAALFRRTLEAAAGVAEPDPRDDLAGALA